MVRIPDTLAQTGQTDNNDFFDPTLFEEAVNVPFVKREKERVGVEQLVANYRRLLETENRDMACLLFDPMNLVDDL